MLAAPQARAGGHERRSRIAAPGRRAVLRWSWRLFRREWRQQLLVLILVTVGVAAAVAGSAMAVNADADPDAEFGTAGALIQIDGSDPRRCARRSRPRASRHGRCIWITATDVPGVAEPIELRAQDPQGPFGQPMLAVLDGRYPKAPDEVALTDGRVTVVGTSASVSSSAASPGRWWARSRTRPNSTTSSRSSLPTPTPPLSP